METLAFRLIRSRARRRTLSLSLKEGELVCRVPFHTTQKEAETFVRSKQDWVHAQMAKCSPSLSESDLNGLEFALAEIPYRLALTERPFQVGRKQAGFAFEGGVLRVARDDKQGRNALSRHLKAALIDFARGFLHDYTRKVAKECDLPMPHHIKSRVAKSVWGTLRTKTNEHHMMINALLLLEPLWVIRATLVHELCHQRHHGHSKDFWALFHRFVDDKRVVHHHLRHARSDLGRFIAKSSSAW